MLSGISGIMNLAAASGEDLASTSDIVTDALTAFGMTAADSSHFADILAVASSNANTNVAMMGETFKYAAPMFGALGYSAEDAALGIGLMANSGIKASSAGTALRAGLTNLAKPTEAMAAAMEKYGISLTDSSGNMISFRDLIAQLRDRLGGLSEVEQTAAAGAIFGKNAMSGWLAIINSADSDVNKLTNAVDNCAGATQQMADTRLDNLNGDLTLADSAFQGLETTIGELFLPALREVVQAGTDVITWLDELIQQNPALVTGFTAFVGVIGAATAAFTAYNAVAKIAAALSAATILPAAPIMIGVTAVAALTAGIVALSTASYDGLPKVKELTEAAAGMDESMEEAGAAFDETAASIQATGSVAEMYIASLEEMGESTSQNARHSEEWIQTCQLLAQQIPELAGLIDTETGAIEGGTEALRENLQAWYDNQEAAAYQEYINSLMGDYNAVMTEASGNKLKLRDAEIRLADAEENAKELHKKYTDALEEQAETGKYSAQELNEMEKAAEDASFQVDTLREETERYAQAVEEDNAKLEEAQDVLERSEAAYESLTESTDMAAQSGEQLSWSQEQVNNALQNASDSISGLADRYAEAYDAALESVQGQFSIWEEAGAIIPTSIGDISSALDTQISYYQECNANMETLRERSADIEGLNEVLKVLAEDGSPEAMAAIAGMASASDEDLQKMVEKFQQNQEEQTKMATNMADVAVDIDGSLQDITDSVADTIGNLNLSEEARTAASETFNGYIQGIRSQYNILDSEMRKWTNRLSSVTRTSTTFAPTGAGKARREVTGKHAGGTSQAAPGWSLVGEMGPELIYFTGGEPTLPPEETRVLRESVQNNEYERVIRELAPIAAPQEEAEQAITVLGGYPAPESVAQPTFAGPESNAPQDWPILPNSVPQEIPAPIVNVETGSIAPESDWSGIDFTGLAAPPEGSTQAAIIANEPVIAGQNGPELVYLQGGERILNASQTQSLREREMRSEVEHFYREIQASPMAAAYYASGTSQAEEGLAWVGERGAELIGNPDQLTSPGVSVLVERSPVQEVMPAETPAWKQDINVTVSPTYTINTSGQDDLRQVLQENTMNLRAQVESIFRDMQDDQMRGAFL